MTERIKSTAAHMRAGTYDWSRIVAIVVNVCVTIEGLNMASDKLPPSVAALMPTLAPWAWMVAFVLTGYLARMGKPVIVQGES